MGQVNSLPQCTVSYPNARRRPSGQILWCGEAAPRREDAIRALRSDPLARASGRVVPSGTVIRRVRAWCTAGAGRRTRFGEDARTEAAGPRYGAPPEPQRMSGPMPRTAPAQPLPTEADPKPRSTRPALTPPPMRAPAGTPAGPGSSPTPHGSPPPVPPGPARPRRPPPRTPHERITHSDVHFRPHPCYDRTRCNRIHY